MGTSPDITAFRQAHPGFEFISTVKSRIALPAHPARAHPCARAQQPNHLWLM